MLQRRSAHVLVAVLAFAMLLAAACLSGIASAGAANAGTLHVEGVRDGDKVNVYLVAKRNPYGIEFTQDFGIAMQDYLAAGSNTKAMKEYADTMFAKVASQQPSASATAGSNGATLNGLEYGQYLISVIPTPPGCGKVYQSTVVNLEQQQAEVVLKSEPITITKTVNGAHETDAYSVGQKVPFVLETHIPAYPDKATHKVFKIKDVHTAGLSFGAQDVTVTVGGQVLKQGVAYTYSQAAEGANTAHLLTFDYDRIAPYGGQAIQVAINALVTEAAVPATADVNTATVYFRNNPFVDSGDDEADDKATVKTYGIYLKKVDEKTEAALAGAVFEVLAADESGDVEIVDNGTTIKMRHVGELTTGEDGFGKITGLAAGVYYLRETAAPEGYGTIDDVLEVTVTASAAASEGDWAGCVFGGTIKDPTDNIEEEETPTTPTDDDEEVPDDDDEDTPNKKTTETDDDTPRSGFAPQTSDIIMGGVVVVLVVAVGAGIVALRKRKEG